MFQDSYPHSIPQNISPVECPDCHGKGAHLQIKRKVEPCISCRGTGHVHGKSCFVCDGTGVQSITYRKEKICNTCHGKGWVADTGEPASVG